MGEHEYIFYKTKINRPRASYLETEFRYPILYGLSGSMTPTDEQIGAALNRVRTEQAGYFLEALWLSEQVEAGETDHEDYFISDDRFRSSCVGLNQRVNAWALLYGSDKVGLNKLAGMLREKNFEIYSAGKADDLIENDHISFSKRETGVVYFAQLLVRYALIYARADAGSSHTLTHEIEEYAPGVIFVSGKLEPFEHLMVQSLLSVGAPVVILGDDQGLVGMVYSSESLAEMVDKAWTLPNVRARLVERPISKIPLMVGPVFSRETIKNPAINIKGTDTSFIAAKPNHDVKEDSFQIIGKDNPNDVSLLIELGNPVVDSVVTVGVEINLLRILKYIHGVKLGLREGHSDALVVSIDAKESGFRYKHIWDLVRTELRNRFPEIGPMKVTLILDHDSVESLGPVIKEYQAARKQLIDNATDESVDAFYGCTRCTSFSISHACTVSPERPSQCGSRPWYVLKTQALLSPDDVYSPSQVIPKGEVIDTIRGEYSEINQSTSERTGGRVNRIFMHSVLDHPHTACSCFQNTAYYIQEVDGIALVDRKYKGYAPNRETWTSLANRVAGYQNTEGYATFATSYLKSAKFFIADGGYDRVVWMTSTLKSLAGDSIPEHRRDKIKTEKETTKTEELVSVS